MNIATIRPAALSDMYPTAAVSALVQAIEEGTFPRVCLFHGETGTGKTTAARLIAAELIKMSKKEAEEFALSGTSAGPEYVEVNVSAQNKVDDARDLERSIIACAGSFSDKPYVYVLDEAQRYTPDAQDALLQVLESVGKESDEKGVYVIVCSTNPEKLKETFKRRCVSFEFGPLNKEQCNRFLDSVCKRLKKKTVGIEIRGRIYDASYGRPGDALNRLQAYLMTGDIPLDPTEHYAGARQVFDLIKVTSNSIIENGMNANVSEIPELMSTIRDFKTTVGSWEQARISLTAAIYYFMKDLSNKGQLDAGSLYLFGRYLDILAPTVIDTGLGEYELISRIIKIIEIRSRELPLMVDQSSQEEETNDGEEEERDNSDRESEEDRGTKQKVRQRNNTKSRRSKR